jgi:hypothetical protein
VVVAVAMLLEWEGMEEDAYRALVEAMDLGGAMFPGAVLHLAGPVAGGWRAVDVWESEEAFERFRVEKLGAALTRAGVAPPRVDLWPVLALATPQGPLTAQR